jgi:hypothetical protein
MRPVGWVSRAERRRADLFAADFFGEDEPQTAAPTPASATSLCARDTPVTDSLALLVANSAPLPIAADEQARAARVSGAVDDYKSVAAIVPSTAERRLLIFFHGNKNYVTVAPNGDVPRSVDPSGHSRIPRWTNAPRGDATPGARLSTLAARQLAAARRANPGAAGKKAAPLQYQLDLLGSSQTALQPASLFTDLGVKDPIVLVPEDAELNTGKYWAVPPTGQYGSASNGSPGRSGTTRLQDLVIECYDHLRCLLNPSGRPYLPSGMASRASWVSNLRRTYVSGHSGGGKPLVEAAGADMVLVTPTSVAGVGGRAIDMWLYDCTYGFGIDNYVNFCENWRSAGLLDYRADAARFVCTYRPRSDESDTETEANALRGRIAAALKVSAASLLVLHDSASMTSRSIIDRVIPALKSQPVVFIRTNVGHDDIPTRFMPLLLRTAAS